MAALRSTARNWAGALVKRAAERAGLEIGRHRPRARRRAQLIAAQGIELVIDVGANRGQYARELRAHGYTERILSFEPSAGAFAALERYARTDPNWDVRQLAASDTKGMAELGAAGNFSSLLPVGERLAALFPEAAPRGTERVGACRLDTADIALPPGRGTLLKLDVQGYERRVLVGARDILQRITLIETELSVVTLYDDQPLLAEMICLLDAEGYRLLTLDPILRDRRTGEYLQFDGLFIRR